MNNRFKGRIFWGVVLLSASLLVVACESTPNNRPQSEAQYRVSFTASWNSTTFPTNFPSNPHFSGLIGATHKTSVNLFERGELASAGIELMAETGGKGTLSNEITALINAGTAFNELSGGGNSGEGTVTLTFDVNSSFPVVSLVSMVAPSPDWFVGVNSLRLFDNGDWLQTVSANLVVYDSGTDSEEVFSPTNGDNDTQPEDSITRLTSDPADTDFLNGVHRTNGAFIGTFTFERIQ